MGDYADRETALREIANRMEATYREKHPELHREREPALKQAVVATQEAYSRNFFPEMKTNWSVYDDNIGHFEDVGCMRCHDGEHVSEEGLVLTNDCTVCHTILRQGSGDREEVASTSEGLAFQHPEDIGEMWREVGCYECHTGTQP